MKSILKLYTTVEIGVRILCESMSGLRMSKLISMKFATIRNQIVGPLGFLCIGQGMWSCFGEIGVIMFLLGQSYF